MNYTTTAGKLYADGAEIQLRGVSHHGFGSTILQPQYLWEQGWKAQLAQIKSLGFNAIRCPIVPETLYSKALVDRLSYLKQPDNSELVGKTPIQVLDLWMAECDRLGLYVLLDFHSPSKMNQYFHWFVTEPLDYGAGKWVETYNQQPYTEPNWLRDLAFIAARYRSNAHFLGIDVFNEPHDRVRWATGGPGLVLWKTAAEKAAAAILKANPNLLIFVQGISDNWEGNEPSVPINWGENLQPQKNAPLSIQADKLVFSPHSYGPDVYMEPEFNAPDYPANLAKNWEQLFGQFSPRHAVVVGEWGGRYGVGGTGQKDKQWQDAFVDYLISKNMRSSFYWCYTPNSGDTGGILADDLTVREDKMSLLRRLWGSQAPPVVEPPPVVKPPPVIGDKTDQIIALLTQIEINTR
jgi:aryl-phospho-beta-D-glucosidase BglC (GH1 family)